MRETLARRVQETERLLLDGSRLRVPRTFESRAKFSELEKLLDRKGKKALGYCRTWAEAPERTRGPLLMGTSGTFKTHILWATARALQARTERTLMQHAAALEGHMGRQIEEGSVVFCQDLRLDEAAWPVFGLLVTDGAEIAHELRSTIERKNLDEVVARYRQEGKPPSRAALMVDDVEVMKLSDWLHEELYRVFNHRYKEAMPTFVATNLSAEELRRHLGDRIARRIMDLTEPFEL